MISVLCVGFELLENEMDMNFSSKFGIDSQHHSSAPVIIDGKPACHHFTANPVLYLMLYTDTSKGSSCDAVCLHGHPPCFVDTRASTTFVPGVESIPKAIIMG